MQARRRAPKPCQQVCTQKGKMGTFVAEEMLKQHAKLYNQHFFIISVVLQFRKGLAFKKKNPAATMGIITHLNVRISFMQRTRKTKILRNTFKITREK